MTQLSARPLLFHPRFSQDYWAIFKHVYATFVDTENKEDAICYLFNDLLYFLFSSFDAV